MSGLPANFNLPFATYLAWVWTHFGMLDHMFAQGAAHVKLLSTLLADHVILS